MGEGEGEGGPACESIEAEEKSQSGPSRMASNSATISAPYSSLSSFGCRLGDIVRCVEMCGDMGEM